MMVRAATLFVMVLLAAPGAAQERGSGYAGLVLGTQGVGLQAALPVTQRWWLGARAQRSFDAASAYVVLPFEASRTSEVRIPSRRAWA